MVGSGEGAVPPPKMLKIFEFCIPYLMVFRKQKDNLNRFQGRSQGFEKGGSTKYFLSAPRGPVAYFEDFKFCKFEGDSLVGAGFQPTSRFRGGVVDEVP